MRRQRFSRLLLGATLPLAVCSAMAAEPAEVAANARGEPIWAPFGQLEASIRWTAYGVPHIRADNLESLGYGFGYAQAGDNLCLVAEAIVKVNGERSRYWGPDGEREGANLRSDFVQLALRHRAMADQLWSGMPAPSRALMRGYAAGYNRFLAASRSGEERPAACSAAPWVRPLTPQDLLAYQFSLGSFAGAEQYSPMLWAASRDPAGKADAAPVDAAFAPPPKLGSNAWAIGRAMTGGGGILLGNPHFPHQGALRFWESHLTVPGYLDVAGASLLAVPGVINIGFNRDVAWSHTYSSARHTLIYRLDIDGQGYRFDGRTLPLSARTYTVQVKRGDKLEPVRRTFYSSHLGLLLQHPLLPWDQKHAYAVFDQNHLNRDSVTHWLALNRARDFRQFQDAFRRYDGTLFNNTIYADRGGNAYYIDDSTVPALSPAAEAAIAADPALQALAGMVGSPVIPASGQALASPGPVPFAAAPQLRRDDFVQNANDSYWLSNPAAPLTGFPALYGGERYEQSFRTRMSLTLLDGLRRQGRPVTARDVETTFWTDRSYLPELIGDDTQTLCRHWSGRPIAVTPTRTVDLAAACAVLARSDYRHSPYSPGAPLWREFGGVFDTAKLLATPFDPADPVRTPRGLKADQDGATALARAVANLESAGWKPESTLAQMQFVTLNDGRAPTRLSWPGGDNLSGSFNTFDDMPAPSDEPLLDVVSGEPLWSGLRREGYRVRHGSSWIMLVGFGPSGPQARALLSYSQSAAADSPHYADQTRRYAARQGLRPVPFLEAEVAAATVRHKVLRQRGTW